MIKQDFKHGDIVATSHRNFADAGINDLIWGNTGTIFGNIIGLGTISAFVFWSKSNKKVNNWLDSEL